MTQPQHRYDGFISYRHHPRDMKIAAKLMNLLEKMSTSDKRRLRIFRDQSELPTSDNLGNDIHTALEQSRFLIILGSPSYLQSKWCMEEVRYFRKLHGGSNHGILPILIEGEPREALPEYLFQQTETIVGPDGKRILHHQEVEPLCADVRGRTDAECLRKLRNTEYLCIAAPTQFAYYHGEQPEYGVGKFSANGSWTEQAPLPDLSQERYRAAQTSECTYTEINIDNHLWPDDAFARDLTQQEKTVIGEIEAEVRAEKPGEDFWYVSDGFTPDGKLMMVYCSFAAEKNAVIPYNYRTYFYSTEENKRLGSCEGFVFTTPVEGILLQLLPDSLRILRYHPENFGNPLEAPEVIRQLSQDGSRMIQGRWADWDEPEMMLCDEDGSTLYRKDTFFRYALPDFSRVLFTDWREKRETVVYDSNGNEIASRELPPFSAWCMNEDGTKVAFGQTDMQGPVQIWDLETDQIIFSEILPYSEKSELFVYEMQGDYLLFNSGLSYVIWNWKENCLVTEGYLLNPEAWFVEAGNLPTAFSEDGLVFIRGDGLGGIYDLKRDRAVSFDTVSVGSLSQLRRSFQYCADSGILVVQSGDTFLIQSRNALGDFETRQKIKTAYPGMRLLDIAPVLNAEYLVISNGSCCEVYHIPDGSLTLRIENPEGSAAYGLIGKELVDLRILDGGPLRRFSIPTTEEARSWAAGYLESAHGRRSLTPEELDDYFIPEEW